MNRVASSPSRRMVVTDGHGGRSEEAYPQRLRQKLPSLRAVTNAVAIRDQ